MGTMQVRVEESRMGEAVEPKVVRGGEGEVLGVLGTRVRFLCEGARSGGRYSMMEVELPKDQGPPPHDHPWDEAYYVIAGRVRFTIGADVQVYSAGDFIHAPAGTLHGFQGADDAPARVLVFDAPSTAEGFFRDAAREVRSPADYPKIPAIGLRHRLRFAPPR